MTNVAAVVWVSCALAVWTAIAYALVRRAQVRAVGSAPVPWFALGTAIGLGAVAIAVRPLPQAATCAVACIALALAADADARTGYLFDALTIPAAFVTLALAIATGAGVSGLTGCALLVVSFGAIVLLSRGRAMGMGDVKAMASIGAAFGPAEALFAISAACASGIVEASIRGRLQRRSEIRFGPHLAVGAAIALAWGEPFARLVVGA
jgi:leader peptidase (prepilin peptidase)/N-methyltransferase